MSCCIVEMGVKKKDVTDHISTPLVGNKEMRRA